MISPSVDNEDITLVRGETLSIDVYLTFDSGEPVSHAQIPVSKMKSEVLCQNGIRIPLTITALPEDGCYNLYSDIDTRKIKGDSFLVNVGIKNLSDNELDNIVIASYNACFHIVNSATSLKEGFPDPIYYDVVFRDYDNTVISSQHKLEGTVVTIPEQPERTGYTFREWSPLVSFYALSDVVYTAQYDINYYDLSYFVDGQQYGETESIAYNSPITTKPAPTKTGYTFSGWEDEPTVMPDDDVEVNGTFTINTYILSYYVDGTLYDRETVQYGAAITARTEPAKTGYTFSGWSGEPSAMPAHDVDVTGTFEINSYRLTYILDGTVYYTANVQYGATITPKESPSSVGHTFSGWIGEPETMPAHDVTVTGNLSANTYTLTYMVDGQQSGAVERIAYGETITPRAKPEEIGKTYTDWSGFPTDMKMPASNLVVTSTSSVNSHHCTFKTYKNDSVVSIIDRVFDYGETIIPPTPTAFEHYTFAWDSYPETMPDEDIVINGYYTANYIGRWQVGSNVWATLYSDGLLHFTGSGNMYNQLDDGYNGDGNGGDYIITAGPLPPYRQYFSQITRVEIEPEITSVATWLLAGGGGYTGSDGDGHGLGYRLHWNPILNDIDFVIKNSDAINIGAALFDMYGTYNYLGRDITVTMEFAGEPPTFYSQATPMGSFAEYGSFASVNLVVKHHSSQAWTDVINNTNAVYAGQGFSSAKSIIFEEIS